MAYFLIWFAKDLGLVKFRQPYISEVVRRRLCEFLQLG